MKKKQIKDTDKIPFPLTDGNVFRHIFTKNPNILGTFLNDMLHLNLTNIKKVEIQSSEIKYNQFTNQKSDLIMSIILNKIYHIDLEIYNNFYY